MRIWRLSKARFANSAFSGEGARLFEGRWNFAGVPMVYTSTSLALAAIEFFVHLDPSVAPDDLVSVCAGIPNNLHRERLLVQESARRLAPGRQSKPSKAGRRLGALQTIRS